uniref:Uncharacterized protein n=1 Tax=Denticeps clupeoides TaxID=299321 RepID=A0AAY4E2F7_9TELE
MCTRGSPFAAMRFALLAAIHCLAQARPTPGRCHLQGRLVGEVHGLLERMGGRFPPECLGDVVAIAAPTAAFRSNGTKRNAGVERAVYHTLTSIDFLFGNDTVPVSWDGRTVEDFQNIVYRQIDESKCVSSRRATADFKDRRRLLGLYFDRLASVLQEKEFSACAWEVVRRELLQTLKFILNNTLGHLFWARRRRNFH